MPKIGLFLGSQETFICFCNLSRNVCAKFCSCTNFFLITQNFYCILTGLSCNDCDTLNAKRILFGIRFAKFLSVVNLGSAFKMGAVDDESLLINLYGLEFQVQLICISVLMYYIKKNFYKSQSYTKRGS